MYVDFITNAPTDSADQYAFSLNNTPQSTHLVYFLYPLFKDNQELKANFLYYCRVQRFAQEPAISEERQRTKMIFSQRARDLYDKEIKPQFQQILDTCPVISSCNVLSLSDTGTAKKAERYKTLLNKHLDNLYEFAQLVNKAETPKSQSELSTKMLRAVDGTLPDMPLSQPEKKIKDWLDRQPHDVTVADVIRQFAKVPYGWSEFATIYYLNELVRRHQYAYNYNNNPNVSREEAARNIVRDSQKFTIEKAKAISQDVLNSFIEAWKHIFNVMTVKGSNDSTELFRNCKETDDSALNKLLKNYRELSRKINGCPFAHVIDEAITLMEQWLTIRQDLTFFETIIAAKDTASELFDRCKNINTFHNDQFDRYEMIRKFIDDNRDNFTFLSDEHQESVKALKAINLDEEPWNSMPSYTKLYRTLDGLLKEKKEKLYKVIEEKYHAVHEELLQYADTAQVSRDKVADIDATIIKKKSSNNFFALQANADTTDYLQQQIKLIDDLRPKDQTEQRRKKVVQLHTHTLMPLKTEKDVDSYLQSLKSELMQHLDGKTDIIVS